MSETKHQTATNKQSLSAVHRPLFAVLRLPSTAHCLLLTAH